MSENAREQLIRLLKDIFSSCPADPFFTNKVALSCILREVSAASDNEDIVTKARALTESFLTKLLPVEQLLTQAEKQQYEIILSDTVTEIGKYRHFFSEYKQTKITEGLDFFINYYHAQLDGLKKRSRKSLTPQARLFIPGVGCYLLDNNKALELLALSPYFDDLRINSTGNHRVMRITSANNSDSAFFKSADARTSLDADIGIGIDTAGAILSELLNPDDEDINQAPALLLQLTGLHIRKIDTSQTLQSEEAIRVLRQAQQERKKMADMVAENPTIAFKTMDVPLDTLAVVSLGVPELSGKDFFALFTRIQQIEKLYPDIWQTNLDFIKNKNGERLAYLRGVLLPALNLSAESPVSRETTSEVLIKLRNNLPDAKCFDFLRRGSEPMVQAQVTQLFDRYSTEMILSACAFIHKYPKIFANNELAFEDVIESADVFAVADVLFPELTGQEQIKRIKEFYLQGDIVNIIGSALRDLVVAEDDGKPDNYQIKIIRDGKGHAIGWKIIIIDADHVFGPLIKAMRDGKHYPWWKNIIACLTYYGDVALVDEQRTRLKNVYQQAVQKIIIQWLKQVCLYSQQIERDIQAGLLDLSSVVNEFTQESHIDLPLKLRPEIAQEVHQRIVIIADILNRSNVCFMDILKKVSPVLYLLYDHYKNKFPDDPYRVYEALSHTDEHIFEEVFPTNPSIDNKQLTTWLSEQTVQQPRDDMEARTQTPEAILHAYLTDHLAAEDYQKTDKFWQLLEWLAGMPVLQPLPQFSTEFVTARLYELLGGDVSEQPTDVHQKYILQQEVFADMALALLQLGANPNGYQDEKRQSFISEETEVRRYQQRPLGVALQHNLHQTCPAALRQLLNYRPDEQGDVERLNPNKHDRKGTLAWFYATKITPALIQQLSQRGANFNLECHGSTKHQGNLLHHVVSRNPNSDIVRELINSGCITYNVSAEETFNFICELKNYSAEEAGQLLQTLGHSCYEFGNYVLRRLLEENAPSHKKETKWQVLTQDKQTFLLPDVLTQKMEKGQNFNAFGRSKLYVFFPEKFGVGIVFKQPESAATEIAWRELGKKLWGAAFYVPPYELVYCAAQKKLWGVSFYIEGQNLQQAFRLDKSLVDFDLSFDEFCLQTILEFFRGHVDGKPDNTMPHQRHLVDVECEMAFFPPFSVDDKGNITVHVKSLRFCSDYMLRPIPRHIKELLLKQLSNSWLTINDWLVHFNNKLAKLNENFQGCMDANIFSAGTGIRFYELAEAITACVRENLETDLTLLTLLKKVLPAVYVIYAPLFDKEPPEEGVEKANRRFFAAFGKMYKSEDVGAAQYRTSFTSREVAKACVSSVQGITQDRVSAQAIIAELEAINTEKTNQEQGDPTKLVLASSKRRFIKGCNLSEKALRKSIAKMHTPFLYVGPKNNGAELSNNDIFKLIRENPIEELELDRTGLTFADIQKLLVSGVLSFLTLKKHVFSQTPASPSVRRRSFSPTHKRSSFGSFPREEPERTLSSFSLLYLHLEECQVQPTIFNMPALRYLHLMDTGIVGLQFLHPLLQLDRLEINEGTREKSSNEFESQLMDIVLRSPALLKNLNQFAELEACLNKKQLAYIINQLQLWSESNIAFLRTNNLLSLESLALSADQLEFLLKASSEAQRKQLYQFNLCGNPFLRLRHFRLLREHVRPSQIIVTDHTSYNLAYRESPTTGKIVLSGSEEDIRFMGYQVTRYGAGLESIDVDVRLVGLKNETITCVHRLLETLYVVGTANGNVYCFDRKNLLLSQYDNGSFIKHTAVKAITSTSIFDKTGTIQLQLLAAAGNKVLLWNLNTGYRFNPITVGLPHSVAISFLHVKGDNFIAVGKNELHCYKLKTRKLSNKFVLPELTQIRFFQSIGDDCWLVADSKSIFIIDLSENKCTILSRFKVESGITAICPLSHYKVAIALGQEIKIWNWPLGDKGFSDVTMAPISADIQHMRLRAENKLEAISSTQRVTIQFPEKTVLLHPLNNFGCHFSVGREETRIICDPLGLSSRGELMQGNTFLKNLAEAIQIFMPGLVEYTIDNVTMRRATSATNFIGLQDNSSSLPQLRLTLELNLAAEDPLYARFLNELYLCVTTIQKKCRFASTAQEPTGEMASLAGHRLHFSLHDRKTATAATPSERETLTSSAPPQLSSSKAEVE